MDLGQELEIEQEQGPLGSPPTTPHHPLLEGDKLLPMSPGPFHGPIFLILGN